MPCLFCRCDNQIPINRVYHGHIDNANTDTIRLQFSCSTQSLIDNRTHRDDRDVFSISQNVAPSHRELIVLAIQFRLIKALQTDIYGTSMMIGKSRSLPCFNRCSRSDDKHIGKSSKKRNFFRPLMCCSHAAAYQAGRPSEEFDILIRNADIITNKLKSMH